MSSNAETPVRASAPPHVVIVGGGFAGLSAARALAEVPVRITLIDRRNHHLFQALLYQVATAALAATDIASPIRSVLRRQRNVAVRLADVTSVDVASKYVVMGEERLAYDYLILAAGAGQSYFGHDEWAPLAPGLKNLDDALEIRRRVLWAFEAAEQTQESADRDALLSFIVVGGGPTGVELAGALAELSRYSLARDFDHINPAEAKVYLLEGADRLLPAFREKLGRVAQRELERLGVRVRTKMLVTGVDHDGVIVGEERIAARTVLWCAGVAASPLGQTLGLPLDRAGRVPIQPDLTIEGHPEVFVIGDMSALKDAKGNPLPGQAPVAIQEGRWAATNLARAVAGEPMQPFQYVDEGMMATIGRNSAVAYWKGREWFGIVAWLLWSTIHIFRIIAFTNRLLVFARWIWAYVTYQRGARVIASERPPDTVGG
ncbi:MAG TPA: NAD(P)/FAD-dependent oxidoreductase [Thermomicrobiales bacterium]|nr:NAD(P)/FAD-dependent oxidoreductase [Thermomicrobiales bacterium]